MINSVGSCKRSNISTVAQHLALPIGVGEVMYSFLILIIEAYLKTLCTYCFYVRCPTFKAWVGRILWPKTGANHYPAQIELPNKGCANQGLVVCSNCDLDLLDLLKISLALGCYKPSPKVYDLTVFMTDSCLYFLDITIENSLRFTVFYQNNAVLVILIKMSCMDVSLICVGW